MASRRHERTAARQSALQVLYTSEIKGTRPSDLLDSGLVLEDDGKSLSDYAIGLIEGVDEKMLPIDVRLNSTSENWKLNRMPIVDRCILRLATYEMLFVDEVPVSVAINEAVELAKDFGGEDESPRFVNGVLGRIARQLEEDAKDPERRAVERKRPWRPTRSRPMKKILRLNLLASSPQQKAPLRTRPRQKARIPRLTPCRPKSRLARQGNRPVLPRSR